MACSLTAHAADSPLFSELSTEPCGSSAAARAFDSALRVELASQRSVPPQPELPQLRLTECDITNGRVVLAAGNEQTSIDVSDVPAVARPRTAAVAVAETLWWWRRSPGADPDAVTEQPEGPQEAAQVVASHDSFIPNTVPANVPRPRPEPPRWDAQVLLRGAVMGPLPSVLWGAEGRVGWRFAPPLVASAGAGYLTSHVESAWGDARLHGVTGAVSLDAVLPAAQPPAGTAEWRLGIGLQGMAITALASSHLGFDEPATREFSATADVHATLLTPLDHTWDIVITLAAHRALRGVRLLSGGEGGFSLYGFGVNAGVGVGRRF